MQRYRFIPLKAVTAIFMLLAAASMFAGASGLEDKLRQDFPLLTARYGTQLGSQKAHYVFVVDVSSSMLPYERIEKENLLKFVDAVPDGDQITIIRMADENHTDFVNMFKCITLDANVRAALKNTVHSPGFQFLQPGDPRDGSDGYNTARLVVDAINTVGSNELTFIYLFTDFEYWTHAHRYDKNQPDWQSLAEKVPDSYRQGMCKFGIELASDGVKHPEAIFKPEMDRIFGTINYQPVTSAAVLSQWFGHIITNVMAYKLDASLRQEWNALLDSLVVETRPDGNHLAARVITPDQGATPLISATDLVLSSSDVLPDVADNVRAGDEAHIGHVDVDRGFLPAMKTVLSDGDSLLLVMHSPYQEEMARLQMICNGGDGEGPNAPAIQLQKKYPLDRTKFSIWASVVPLWCWIIILLIILVIIASVLYTMFVLKTTHPWMVRVKENGINVKSPAPDYTAPFTIGNRGDYPVPDVTWQIRITGKKYNPLLLWKKSGYYITWTGAPVTVRDRFGTDVAACTPGEETWFSPLRSGGVFLIDKNGYRIEMVV